MASDSTNALFLVEGLCSDFTPLLPFAGSPLQDGVSLCLWGMFVMMEKALPCDETLKLSGEKREILKPHSRFLLSGHCWAPCVLM